MNNEILKKDKPIRAVAVLPQKFEDNARVYYDKEMNSFQLCRCLANTFAVHAVSQILTQHPEADDYEIKRQSRTLFYLLENDYFHITSDKITKMGLEADMDVIDNLLNGDLDKTISYVILYDDEVVFHGDLAMELFIHIGYSFFHDVLLKQNPQDDKSVENVMLLGYTLYRFMMDSVGQIGDDPNIYGAFNYIEEIFKGIIQKFKENFGEETSTVNS